MALLRNPSGLKPEMLLRDRPLHQALRRQLADPPITRFIHLAQFPILLQVEPKTWRSTQRPGKLHRHRGADAAFTTADFVDRFRQDADMSGKLCLRQPSFLKLVLQDQPRMNINGVVHTKLMIVDDFDTLGSIIAPMETDPVLVVDAND